MKVQLLRSVKDGSGWHESGAIIDYEDQLAKKLIRQHVAAALATPAIGESVFVNEASADADDTERLEQLMTIDGVSSDIASKLLSAGLRTVQDVAEAQLETLTAIKGISRKLATKIRESADDIVDQ